MIAPLEPEHLTPTASLNRLPMLPLPGADIEPDIVGKPAYAVLSLAALAQEIRAHASSLQLHVEAIDDVQLPLLLNACFASANPDVWAQADAIATRWGRRLGHVVLTFERGDQTGRTARPDWDDTFWHHWSNIRHIWLGGGLANGHVGACIIRNAREVLQAVGNAAGTLALAEYPALLPLIGAARSVPAGYAGALVFDLGGTIVKRALATYKNGRLRALQVLPPVPTPLASQAVMDEWAHDDLVQLATQIGTLLADTWQAHAMVVRNPAPVLVCSVASYVAGNHPLPRQSGSYAALHTITGNLGSWLSDKVGARGNRSIDVMLLHDGTAAAQTYAGTPHTAVITMGTALGVGFPASSDELRPIDPTFVVYPAVDASGIKH